MNKRVKREISIFLTCIVILGSVASNFIFSNKVSANQLNFSNRSYESLNKNLTVDDAIKLLVKYYENDYINQLGKNINVCQWAALKKAGVYDFTRWEVNNKLEDLNSETLSLRLYAEAKQSLILMDLGEDPSNFEGINLIDKILEDINKSLEGIYTSSIQTPGSRAEALAVTAVKRFNNIYTDKQVKFKTTKVGQIEKVEKPDDEWIVNAMYTGKKVNTIDDYSYIIPMLFYYKDRKDISENLDKFLKIYKEHMKNNGGIYTTTCNMDIYATITQINLISLLLQIERNPFKWIKEGHTLIDGLFIKWDGKCFRNNDELKDIYSLNKLFYLLTIMKDKGYGNENINNLDLSKLDYTKESLIERIKINCNNKEELNIGDKVKFTIDIYPKDAVNRNIDWISFNENVITIDKNGVATAVGAGESNICVWSSQGKCIESNTCKLKVKPSHITGVQVDKKEIKLKVNELMRINAKILPENASNKNIKWYTSDEKVVKIDDKGLITPIGKGKAIITVETEDGKFKDTCKVEVTNSQGSSDSNYKLIIEDTIDNICKNIDLDEIDIAKSKLSAADYWTILELNKLDKNIPNDYLKNITYKLKNNKEYLTTTDYAKIVLALLSIGGNPLDVDGLNIIDNIYNGNMKTIYDYIFALIALDAGDFGTPDNCKWNRDKILSNLITAATPDGGWALGEGKADIDTTAMVITALAPYYDSRSDVRNAIDKAIKLLSLKQKMNASFTSYFGKENSNSISMVIIALCENGINPIQDNRFIKSESNLIDILMQYRTEDGKGFGFIDKKYNYISTEQALRALLSYKNLLEKKGSIYKFNINSNKGAFRIQNLTDISQIKLTNDGKIVIKATNMNKESKKASLIIGLFNEQDKLLDYVCTKQLVQTGDSIELMGMIKIPNEGKYVLKGFVWDDVEEMNCLSNVIEIDVK